MVINSLEDLLRAYEIAFLPLFQEWLEKINALERPFYPLNAIHFGLFDADEGFVVYWIGTHLFEIDQDIDNEWIEEAEYEPHIQQKFLYLPFTLVTEEWVNAQFMVLRALRAYIASADFAFSIFCKAERITLGFDDGDVHQIK